MVLIGESNAMSWSCISDMCDDSVWREINQWTIACNSALQMASKSTVGVVSMNVSLLHSLYHHPLSLPGDKVVKDSRPCLCTLPCKWKMWTGVYETIPHHYRILLDRIWQLYRILASSSGLHNHENILSCDTYHCPEIFIDTPVNALFLKIIRWSMNEEWCLGSNLRWWTLVFHA